MTLEEFYNKVDGNYAEVMDRLLKPERVIRYLNMFLEDESYKKLCDSMAVKDYEAGFQHSHNLKGTCLNLGLTSLYRPSSAICEELRHGNPGPDTDNLLSEVKKTYEETVSLIKELA